MLSTFPYLRCKFSSTSRLSRGVFLTLLTVNSCYAWNSDLRDGGHDDKPSTTLTDKKIITHHAYANWRGIANTTLSRDGHWAAYALVAQEADGEVVFKQLENGQEWRFPRGISPAFSADGRYAAFAIKPTQSQIDKARKEKKKGDDAPKSDLGIVDLITGKLETITRVKQFAWPEEGGNYLAVLREPKSEEKKTVSSKEKTDIDAINFDDQEASGNPETKKKALASAFSVIDVQNHVQKNVDQVVNFTWAKNGSSLAFSVQHNANKKEPRGSDASVKASADESQLHSAVDPLPDGLYIYHPQERQEQAILLGTGSYKKCRFNDSGTMLAFVSNRDEVAKNASANGVDNEKTSTPQSETKADKDADKEAEKEALIYQLFYWQSGQQSAQLLANANTQGMPDHWGVSELGELKFSKDSERLFFSTAEIPKPDSKVDDDIVKVDLWHWQDAELQSVQKVNAEKDKHKTYQAVIHLTDRQFVQLATPSIPNVVFNENALYTLGINDAPYKMMSSWDAKYQDAYAIDLRNGQSRLLAKKLRFSASLSPTGKYVLAFDAATSNWMAWNTVDGKTINLTKKIKTHFEDREHDTPEPRSPYGVVGWRAEDNAVLLYDQYDLWEVNPLTLESRNVSEGFGRQHELALRYLALDEEAKPEAEEAMPEAHSKVLPAEKFLLIATHAKNHSMGFFAQNANGGKPTELMLENKMLAGVVKAKQADTVLFTQQSFIEFPDLWKSNIQFQQPRKISSANPQQVKYQWGTQEQIEYISKDGKKLHALLAKPENFDPSKKYPLMVYIYEKMTDNLYRYVPPSPSQNINVTRYVSNGYIVLRPDIVYQVGHPGKSAMNAVIPAINKVVGLGYVDPQRIGIQGHSWGAYQINYMLTQTTMFRAAEAGAAVANMVSGYGGIRWGKGVSRAFQYETGQSRIGGTPWNKTSEYIENSAIFHIDKIQTPYLTKHNDGDDAVPWYQAIEFFTAMRRLGKEAYWFNYNGEKHGLKDRENIKHYTVHLDEYFDHFLLGQPRPDWMTLPIPYLQRGRRDVKPLFTPEDLMTAPASSSK